MSPSLPRAWGGHWNPQKRPNGPLDGPGRPFFEWPRAGSPRPGPGQGGGAGRAKRQTVSFEVLAWGHACTAPADRVSRPPFFEARGALRVAVSLPARAHARRSHLQEIVTPCPHMMAPFAETLGIKDLKCTTTPFPPPIGPSVRQGERICWFRTHLTVLSPRLDPTPPNTTQNCAFPAGQAFFRPSAPSVSPRDTACTPQPRALSTPTSGLGPGAAWEKRPLKPGRTGSGLFGLARGAREPESHPLNPPPPLHRIARYRPPRGGKGGLASWRGPPTRPLTPIGHFSPTSVSMPSPGPPHV
eukprot:scaffold2948_cov296-Prasinococcus_capsulatus_cf.AAC.3